MNNADLTNALFDMKGSFVEVCIVGAIRVPYYFEDFQVCGDDGIIRFGQMECEGYYFNLWLDTVGIVEISEDFVKLKIDYDDLVTYLEVTKN